MNMRVTARTRSNIAALPAAVFAGLLAVMLGGCGQKGPLMMPGDQDARPGASSGGNAQPGGGSSAGDPSEEEARSDEDEE
jgi:predicted small lipoprotein YifL